MFALLEKPGFEDLAQRIKRTSIMYARILQARVRYCMFWVVDEKERQYRF